MNLKNLMHISEKQKKTEIFLLNSSYRFKNEIYKFAQLYLKLHLHAPDDKGISFSAFSPRSPLTTDEHLYIYKKYNITGAIEFINDVIFSNLYPNQESSRFRFWGCSIKDIRKLNDFLPDVIKYYMENNEKF